jgi:hypothetical protein
MFAMFGGVGFRSLEFGCRSLEFGCRSLEFGFRSLELGCRSLELGCRSLEFALLCREFFVSTGGLVQLCLAVWQSLFIFFMLRSYRSMFYVKAQIFRPFVASQTVVVVVRELAALFATLG